MILGMYVILQNNLTWLIAFHECCRLLCSVWFLTIWVSLSSSQSDYNPPSNFVIWRHVSTVWFVIFCCPCWQMLICQGICAYVWQMLCIISIHREWHMLILAINMWWHDLKPPVSLTLALLSSSFHMQWQIVALRRILKQSFNFLNKNLNSDFFYCIWHSHAFALLFSQCILQPALVEPRYIASAFNMSCISC